MADIPGQLSRVERDLTSIQTILRDQVGRYVPEWTDLNDSNEAAYFLYAQAALVEMMDFLVSRAAANTNMQTVFERPSAVANARTLNYAVHGYTGALTTLRFTFYTPPVGLTIPAGTTVQSSGGTRISGRSILTFYTLVDTAVPLGENYVDIAAKEGQFTTEQNLGQSTGAQFQEYKIPDNDVDISTITVRVGYTWASSIVWTQQDDLLKEPYDTTQGWWLRLHRDGFYYVCFGDGLVGAIPTSGEYIWAEYYTVAGTAGNVGAGTITAYLPPPASPLPNLNDYDLTSVTNIIAATGGYRPEDIVEIARNAPRMYKTIERAVHEDDYGYIAAQLADVHSASGVWNCGVYCYIYFVPSVGPLSYDITESDPEYLAHATLVEDISTEISNPILDDNGDVIGIGSPPGILDEKRCVGTVLLVREARYVTVNVDITSYANRGESVQSLENRVPDAVDEFFDYHSWEIGQSLYLAEFYTYLESIPGVRYNDITSITVTPWVEEIYVATGTYSFTFGTSVLNTAYNRKVIMVSPTEFLVTVTDPDTLVESYEGTGEVGTQYTSPVGSSQGQVTFTLTATNLIAGDAWVIRTNPDNDDIHIEADEFIRPGIITVTVNP